MVKKIKSNQRRCPLLAITKKVITYDDLGRVVSEETVTELNDCYKSFCMAWSKETGDCKIYPDFDMIEEVEEDEPGL